MKPLRTIRKEDIAGLVGVAFDLDDTVLSHGVLTREAYDALWMLHESGLRLVAVTGRPSGWGEVFVRQWPIDGAVTENGAVHLVRKGKRVDVVIDGEDHRFALDALVEEVELAFPEVKLADDVHARQADVAWDIGEHDNVPPPRVVAIRAIAEARGARTTQSSVHVHATFARDDKASGTVRFLGRTFGEDAGSALARWAFVGDSANDSPCFSAFRRTFGVANVRASLRSLNVTPRWVAAAERGAGFAEIAAVLAAR